MPSQHIVTQFKIGEETILCVIERKRVKNMTLRVRRDETVHVSAPLSIRQSQIQSFLEKEQAYILQAIHKIRAYNKTHPILTLQDGDTLCIGGEKYTLDYRLGLTNTMYRKGQIIYLETKNASLEEKRRQYHMFLYAQGERLFPQSVERIFPLMAPYHIAMPMFRQRLMTSRWGSCIPAKQRITLNTYLAIMPPRVIDHVVLHELCHLVQPNHSRHFYNIMTMVMPDWKERRAAIEQYVSYCI